MAINPALQQLLTQLNNMREPTQDEMELAAKKLTRANITLASSPQFVLLSGLLAAMSHRLDVRVPTACTYGLRVWWNPHWVNSMKPPEIAFVMAHEAGHNFLMHFSQAIRRLKEQDPGKCAIAIDQVVNNFLVDCDPNESVIAMPRDANGDIFGCLDRQYQNMSTFEVFKLLPPPQGGGGGFDDHDFQKDLTPEEQKELDMAIQHGKRRAEAMGNRVRDIDESLHSRQRNWLDLLAQWLYSKGKGKGQTTWKRPRRKFIGQDIYLPAPMGHALRHAVFSVDTSGSIGGDELSRAIHLMKEVVRQVGCDYLHIIYWDHGVENHETYRFADSRKLSKTQPKGGGGTDFAPVLRYLEEQKIKPDVMITTTDGYIGDWGNRPDFPMLFVITTDVKPPYGEHLQA